MRRKKIVMVIPQLSLGGAEHSFFKVYSRLVKTYHVEVVLFNRTGELAYPIPENSIHSLDVNGGNGYLGKLIALFKRYRKLRKLVEREKPDIILSYLEGANYLVCFLPETYRRIISQRGSVYHDETMNSSFRLVRQKLLIPYLYPRADHVVALNKGIAVELAEITGMKHGITVIPNMFPHQEIQHLAESNSAQINNPHNRYILCVAGRLAPEKGYHHLIQIMSKLSKKRPGLFSLLIMGEGPEYERLTFIADNLELSRVDDFSDHIELSADIIFLGRRKNPYSIIGKSDALLISSSSEGGPNILVESMICKTLVISANCPSGPRVHIAPNKEVPFSISKPVISENGILMPGFSQGNNDDVYNCWADFLNDFVRKSDLTNQIVESAFEYSYNFRFENVSNQWVSILEQ